MPNRLPCRVRIGDLFGDIAPQLAERLSGFTMRASGLSYWTDMAKTAFRMEFSGFLADNTGRAFEQIDAPLLEILKSRGITAADWEHLRNPQALFRTDEGATFLSPIHWLNRTSMPKVEAEGLALRLQMIIEEELELAVPTASLEAKAWVLRGTDPGSPIGLLARSSFKYKAFTGTLMLNQIRRFNALPTPSSKAKYAASILGGLTLLGALAVQMKEISKGRDPRPMDEKKFWLAAFMQGGGAGIFGDFFASETSRARGGIAETLAGPMAGLASDIVKPVASNLNRAFEGKDTLFGRDLANFTRRNTPVASSLWYTRLAFDRLVSDQLQSFLDPEAEVQWRRQERRRQREYGTATRSAGCSAGGADTSLRVVGTLARAYVPTDQAVPMWDAAYGGFVNGPVATDIPLAQAAAETAVRAAEQAALYDGPRFDAVSQVQADTAMNYSNVNVGDYIRVGQNILYRVELAVMVKHWFTPFTPVKVPRFGYQEPMPVEARPLCWRCAHGFLFITLKVIKVHFFDATNGGLS
ncbi:hypothetical protein [Profundibacter sp.]